MTREEVIYLDRNMRTECYDCVHMREVPWNTHIACVNPSFNVMKSGNEHGKKHGWFFYPLLYDPRWKECLCENFQNSVSHVVSPAVSPETNAAHVQPDNLQG